MKVRLVLAFPTVVALLAGCGGDSDDSSTASPTSTATASASANASASASPSVSPLTGELGSTLTTSAGVSVRFPEMTPIDGNGANLTSVDGATIDGFDVRASLQVANNSTGPIELESDDVELEVRLGSDDRDCVQVFSPEVPVESRAPGSVRAGEERVWSPQFVCPDATADTPFVLTIDIDGESDLVFSYDKLSGLLPYEG